MAMCNKNSTITWFSSRGTSISAVSYIGVEKQRTFFEYIYARRVNRVFTLRKDATTESTRLLALAVYTTQSPINYSRQVTYSTTFATPEPSLAFFEHNETVSYVAVYEKDGPTRIEYFQYRSGAVFRSLGILSFDFPDKTLQGIYREYAVLLAADKETYEIYLLSMDQQAPPEDEGRLKYTLLMQIKSNSTNKVASMGLLPGTMKKFDTTTEDLFWLIAGNSLYLFGKQRVPAVHELSCSFNGPTVDGSWKLLGMDLSDPLNRLFLLHNTSHVLVMQRNFGYLKALESEGPVQGIGAIMLHGKRSPAIVVADGEILDFHSEQQLEIEFDQGGALSEQNPVITRKLSLSFATKQNTEITLNLTLNIVQGLRSKQVGVWEWCAQDGVCPGRVGELFKKIHLYDNEMNTKSLFLRVAPSFVCFVWSG